MPAACSLSGRLSTRKASTTMSCVEDVVATNSAARATNSGERAGSVNASSRIAAISSNCENTSQPRRRPKARVNNGTCSASTSGAHRNFKRVGRADQREQADGAEIDAGFAHPHQQRRSRQRQRQAGGEAEQQHDQHARLQIDGEAVAPGGGGLRCGHACARYRVLKSCRVLADSGVKNDTVIARLDRANPPWVARSSRAMTPEFAARSEQNSYSPACSLRGAGNSSGVPLLTKRGTSTGASVLLKSSSSILPARFSILSAEIRIWRTSSFACEK